MQHFYEQLRGETIIKAVELHPAQKNIRGLTAEYVVKYRNQRLEEFGQLEKQI
jgi:hypothetical protein